MGDSQPTKGMYIPRPIAQYAEQFTGDIESAKSIREWVSTIQGAVVIYEAHTDFDGTRSSLTVHDRATSKKLQPGDWVMGDELQQRLVILPDSMFKDVYMDKAESPWA